MTRMGQARLLAGLLIASIAIMVCAAQRFSADRSTLPTVQQSRAAAAAPTPTLAPPREAPQSSTTSTFEATVNTNVLYVTIEAEADANKPGNR